MKKIAQWEFKDWLAMIVCFGVLTLLGVLQLRAIPTDNKDIVNISLGAILGGVIARIAGHYYPSATPTKTDKDNGSTTV